MTGVFAAGKILNALTARSQFMGGMVWGISFALHEHTIYDERLGRIVNNNLAEYHVPTNADVGAIDVSLGGRGRSACKPDGREGDRRNWDYRLGSRDRECGLSRDRKTSSRSADHAR